MRSLVADSALGSSLLPVFTGLLQRGERERAWRVASAVLTLTAIFTTAVSLVGILAARPILETFTSLTEAQVDLGVPIVQILFPTVSLLALNGIVNAILNSFDVYFVPAIAPVAWNVVIIGFLVVGFSTPSERTRVLLYAVGTLVGTAVQLAICLPPLRGRGGRLRFTADARDPAVRQILVLMLPIALSLGLINVNLFFALAWFATAIDPIHAARSIEAAFRVYMLPQGVFSVAVASVLFPTLARLAQAGDLRGVADHVRQGASQIAFLLMPSSVVLAVLADPITRLLYQRGVWTSADTGRTAPALAALCLGLTANGVVLVLNRTFYAMQRPWLPAVIAGASLALNLVLYATLGPWLGIWGIPLAMSISNLATVGVMWIVLGRTIGALGTRLALASLARSVVASIAAGAVALVVWNLIDGALGQSTLAQIGAVGLACAAAIAAYLAATLALRMPEAQMIARLAGRLAGRS